MPPIESTPMVVVPEVKSSEEVAAAKPVIGIIYPPPEVRNIVDKTASFVARNGPEFESRIRQNEVNNPKFNFLNPADPYHAYYQHKVKEFKEGRGQEPAAPKFGGQLPGLQKPLLEQARIIDIPIIPTEPPSEFEFVADPPSISAFDLDVVKLTAQFVARNGRQFLTNLMNREQRNYQFDFLRPQHSLFNYFTKLVEQYTKILIPPKDLLTQLKSESDDYHKVLNQVKYRVEWAKYQERERRKEAEAIERERVAYAQVDWHDFVVVETVDFQPSEQGNLPPPTTPAEVGARVLAQERIDRGEVDEGEEMEVESDDEEEVEIEKNVGKTRPAEIELQDMDESSSSEEEEELRRNIALPRPPAPAPPPPPPPSEIPAPPLPPMPDQVVVRKDYDPKAKSLPIDDLSDQYLISPITGEKIPAHKVQEHMRIGLLDPKWIEARKRTITEKRDQEEVFAPGSAIESSLKMLAERRTDIFGAGVEETQIGKKIGEEEKKEKKVVWDGHTASMEKVTQKARENITIEEQIAVIHKVKGLLPDEEKEKIGPAIPKQPPPPKAAPPPPPPKSQPPPPQVKPSPMQQKMPLRPPQQHMPQPLMQQPRGGLMVLPPRPPMPLGIHPQMHMPQHMMPGPHGPPHPPNYPPSLMGNRPPGPPHKSHHPPPPSMDDEPMSKKQKTEDQLIPEVEFLKRNKGPVTFKVVIPKVTEKAEWKLNGQTLSFTLPLTDTISVMKAKLNESLGLPAGKQKLQHEGIFMKDSNSLAYYNFMKGATVQLQLKERGGRKK